MSNVSWEWLSRSTAGADNTILMQKRLTVQFHCSLIHPPVHPKLQNLIVRIGRKIQLSRQDKLHFLRPKYQSSCSRDQRSYSTEFRQPNRRN